MIHNGEELDKPIIDLNGQSFGLLFLRTSGVYYTSQVGGYACLHPREEGVFAPLPIDRDEEDKIAGYFIGPTWRGWCCEGIDDETASFLDSEFARSETLAFLRVDRDRLRDSREAWIYVQVFEPAGDPEINPFAGFGTCCAVLTWGNSD